MARSRTIITTSVKTRIRIRRSLKIYFFYISQRSKLYIFIYYGIL